MLDCSRSDRRLAAPRRLGLYLLKARGPRAVRRFQLAIEDHRERRTVDERRSNTYGKCQPPTNSFPEFG